jgi:hypothetical protein
MYNILILCHCILAPSEGIAEATISKLLAENFIVELQMKSYLQATDKDEFVAVDWPT